MKRKMQYLLDEIESEYRYTGGMTGKYTFAPKVKAALSRSIDGINALWCSIYR